MEKRKIGNLEVAPLAFGGNVFGWTVDEKKSFELLDAFVDAGLNFIDTADAYSTWVPGNKGGESETIIGNWLKARNNREKVIIATKVGSPMGGDKKGLSEKYIYSAVEDSLKRLKTDYIDLYQSHYDDEQTPIEETLHAYSKLITEGKIRVIGASNFSKQRLKESLDVSYQNRIPRYDSFQPEYNLFDREDFEKRHASLCLEENIGVITYFSLASGFLTGKYRSEEDLNKSQRGGGVKKYLNERGFRILNALDEISAEYNANPAQVSLVWLIQRPGITAPIASATNLKQLDDLIKSVSLSLSSDVIAKLDKASSY